MVWEDERILVTGGGGFLGKAIIRRLLDLDCSHIRSIGRSPQPTLEKAGVNVVEGDIRDFDTLADAARDCSIVFHTAAKAGVWGRRDDYVSINVAGTENVLAVCKEKGVQALVHTSSPSVSYPPTRHIENIDETEPMPDSYLAYYPESKALAERRVLEDDNESLARAAIRPHLIWGPGDPHLLPRLVARGKAGRLRIVGDGGSKVDLTYIENAAEAHLKAAENLRTSQTANGKAYFISDGEPVKLWDWINNLLEECEIPRVEKSISYKAAYRIGAVLETVYTVLPFSGEPSMTRFVAGQLAFSHYFNIERARKELAYSAVVNPYEALRKTIAWVKHDLLQSSAR